jgi:hypothetical protein
LLPPTGAAFWSTEPTPEPVSAELPVEPLPVEPLPVEPLPVEPLPVEPLPVESLLLEPVAVESVELPGAVVRVVVAVFVVVPEAWSAVCVTPAMSAAVASPPPSELSQTTARIRRRSGGCPVMGQPSFRAGQAGLSPASRLP